MSAALPALALRLYVRSSGALRVAAIVEPQNDLVLGLLGPAVAFLQPMVVPWENQRQDCPTLQMPVPLPQLHPQPSVPGGMQPLGTWLFHPGSPGFVAFGCAQLRRRRG